MTSQPYKPSASEIARYDQARAEADENLNLLVNAHREGLAEGSEPRALSVCGIAAYLEQNASAEYLAQVLAAAIDRLVEPQP